MVEKLQEIKEALKKEIDETNKLIKINQDNQDTAFNLLDQANIQVKEVQTSLQELQISNQTLQEKLNRLETVNEYLTAEERGEQ